MKFLLMFMLVFGLLAEVSAKDGYPDEEMIEEYVEEDNNYNNIPTQPQQLDPNVNISVVGQGIAPVFATSHAQSFALAKRAAMADAYRLLAEQINGVRINGKDTIKNMAIKSSTINTKVEAMIKNAKVVETTFKDGMCEVEMEVTVNRRNF